MFITQSAGRTRAVRVAFVLLGLLPSVALVAWAATRASDLHLAHVRGRWERALGTPLSIGAVSHVRPGAIRADRVAVLDPDGGRCLDLDTVEVESAAGEDRLRLANARIDGGSARRLAALAEAWLRDGVRFQRNCVVEVGHLVWAGGPPDAAGSAAGVRVECVAAAGSRAIRVVSAGCDVIDELRLVRTAADPDTGSPPRYEIRGHWSRPMPAELLAAALGLRADASSACGPACRVSGELEAEGGAGSWSGTARARVEGLDIASCAAAVGSRAAGEASVAVHRAVWRDGRLREAVAEFVAGRGWIATPLLDRLAVALGCRIAPALRGPHVTEQVAFDEAAVVVDLAPGGIRLAAVPALQGALARAGGGPLVEPSTTRVPFDRIAWMLSPPAAAFVPAVGPGAWLMSIVPSGEQGVRTATPAAPTDGREF